MGENQDIALQDLLPDAAPLPGEAVLQDSIKQSVLESLDDLTSQQREVMILRYGLLIASNVSIVSLGDDSQGLGSTIAG